MSILLDQKGKLEREMEEMRKEKLELADRNMALEMMVSGNPLS